MLGFLTKVQVRVSRKSRSPSVHGCGSVLVIPGVPQLVYPDRGRVRKHSLSDNRSVCGIVDLYSVYYGLADLRLGLGELEQGIVEVPLLWQRRVCRKTDRESDRGMVREG